MGIMVFGRIKLFVEQKEAIDFEATKIRKSDLFSLVCHLSFGHTKIQTFVRQVGNNVPTIFGIVSAMGAR